MLALPLVLLLCLVSTFIYNFNLLLTRTGKTRYMISIVYHSFFVLMEDNVYLLMEVPEYCVGCWVRLLRKASDY